MLLVGSVNAGTLSGKHDAGTAADASGDALLSGGRRRWCGRPLDSGLDVRLLGENNESRGGWVAAVAVVAFRGDREDTE